MVSLKGENPISGDSVDAASISDWRRYGVGAFVLIVALMAAKGGADIAQKRLNLRERASESLPSLT